MLFKQLRIRDRKHLDWLRELPCVVCAKNCNDIILYHGLSAPSEPSHIRLKSKSGIGLKPSDSACVPLCHEHHMESHRGERSFWGDKLDQAVALGQNLYSVTDDRVAALKFIREFNP